MSTKKKTIPIFSLLTTILLIGGFIAGIILTKTSKEIRSRASNNGSTLAITPATASLPIAGSTTLGIRLHTNNDTVSAIQLHLTYNPSFVEITSFTPKSALPVVLAPLHIANGNLTITLGVTPEHPFNGSDIIGQLNIKALAKGQATLSFADDTIVTAIEKDTNTLSQRTGATITIDVPSSHTPTPTPQQAAPVVGDFTLDNKVTIADYTLFMNYWFTKNIAKGDLNGDGKISAIDYTIFMNAWNESH